MLGTTFVPSGNRQRYLLCSLAPVQLHASVPEQPL